MDTKNRNNKLDKIKGLAIILVVIGHIYQYIIDPTNYQNHIIFKMIYSFHMPLFMCISGYTNKKYGNITNFQHLIKRTMSLLVPFVCWAVLKSLLSGFPFIEIIINPENGLWFLFVLAIITIFVYIAELLYKYIGSISYLLIGGLLILPFSKFSFNLVKIYYVFYLLGYLFDKLNKIDIKGIEMLVIVAYIISMFFYRWNELPTFVSCFKFNGLIEKLFIAFCQFYRVFMVPILGVTSFLVVINKILGNEKMYCHILVSILSRYIQYIFIL